MKRKTFFIVLSAALLAPALPGTAATETNRQPGGVTFSQTADVTATIQDIDYKNRIVTLKDPQGNVAQVEVGEDAPNFNQLKKGDRVRARYYQSTALALRKPGEVPTSREESQVRVVPGQGQTGPSRTMVHTRQITGTVQDIDRKNRTVTLKGPEGNTVQLKVDESLKGFDKLKLGDQIVATFTDALALSVARD